MKTTYTRLEFANMLGREVSAIKSICRKFERIAPKPLGEYKGKTNKHMYSAAEVDAFLANEDVKAFLSKHEIRRTCRLHHTYRINSVKLDAVEGYPSEFFLDEILKISRQFLAMPIWRWGKKIINEVEYG